MQGQTIGGSPERGESYLIGGYRPILLKKAASNSTAEKYAPEIEL